MPQAATSKLPPAHNECRVSFSEKGEQKDNSSGNVSIPSASDLNATSRRGVFPFSWGWQLAGLISTIVTGLMFVGVFAASGGAYGFLLVGLTLLGLSIYSAVETNWLREASSKPLPVKIVSGTAVICGLVPIAISLFGFAILGAILAGLFCLSPK